MRFFRLTSAIRLLLLGIALGSVAHAQSPTVNLHFVSFPKLANAETVELLVGEGKTIEIELPTNSISKSYQVAPLASWLIGKSSVDAEGKFKFETYGQTQSIGTKNQMILAVRKGKDNAGGLHLIPMDYSQTGFGGGEYFLMNATVLEIAGDVGTSKFALKPLKHVLLDPKPTKKSGEREYAFAKFYFRKGEEVQPFFSSTWRYSENARSMVFFYQDPKTMHLRLHTIRDYLE